MGNNIVAVLVYAADAEAYCIMYFLLQGSMEWCMSPTNPCLSPSVAGNEVGFDINMRESLFHTDPVVDRRAVSACLFSL